MANSVIYDKSHNPSWQQHGPLGFGTIWNHRVLCHEMNKACLFTILKTRMNPTIRQQPNILNELLGLPLCGLPGDVQTEAPCVRVALCGQRPPGGRSKEKNISPPREKPNKLQSETRKRLNNFVAAEKEERERPDRDSNSKFQIPIQNSTRTRFRFAFGFKFFRLLQYAIQIFSYLS